jgi:hypothetical protein
LFGISFQTFLLVDFGLPAPPPLNRRRWTGSPLLCLAALANRTEVTPCVYQHFWTCGFPVPLRERLPKGNLPLTEDGSNKILENTSQLPAQVNAQVNSQGGASQLPGGPSQLPGGPSQPPGGPSQRPGNPSQRPGGTSQLPWSPSQRPSQLPGGSKSTPREVNPLGAQVNVQ